MADYIDQLIAAIADLQRHKVSTPVGTVTATGPPVMVEIDGDPEPVDCSWTVVVGDNVRLLVSSQGRPVVQAVL